MEINCPVCGKSTLVNINPHNGDTTFMLISTNLNNGNFNIPPNGIAVQVKGCTTCGYIFLGSSYLIENPHMFK